MSEEMTREEAIKHIKAMCQMLLGADNKPISDTYYALEMAISALSAEPCGYAISKDKVFDILDYWYDEDSDGYVQACKSINELPSVHAEPRTGHWIFEEGDGETCVDGYVCSACNKSFHTHVPYFAEYEFCPHCGADMRESEDAE